MTTVSEPSIRIDGPPPLLSVNELHVAFEGVDKDIEVVRGLSFSLAPGEVVGLVGESGSGKTIACKAVLSLLPKRARVTGGEILLNGRDVTRMSPAEQAAIRGRHVALIPQDPLSSLNPVIRIGPQIIETIRFHRHVGAREAGDIAVELLDMVKIREPRLVMRRYPHELSGGMRQRIVSVIALSARPSVVVADEPTTSLDVTIQHQFIETLKTLQRQLNFGMVFITHDLALISGLADRLCVMRSGMVVDSGTARDVFTRPTSDYTRRLLAAVPQIVADDPRQAGEKHV